MMRVCKECGREFELAPGEILAAQTKVTVTILVMQILQVLVLM